MSVRVAELEALFTGNVDDFEAKARQVEQRQAQIDGSTTQARVDADVDDATRSLDDVRSELDDLAREDTELTLGADTDDATRQIEDVADELDDLRREDVEVEVDVDADGARDGLKRAEEGLGDFKDESSQIARESATSFSGEFEDVSDVIRDLAANAFQGWGAAGAAAGVAVAAGIGIAVEAAIKLKEENDEAAEAAAGIGEEMADGVLHGRDTFREWATEIREDNAFTFWRDEAESNITAVAETFTQLGEVGAEALAAIADSDLESMTVAFDALNAELESMAELYNEDVQEGLMTAGAAMESNREQSSNLTDAERERMAVLAEASEVLGEQIEKQRNAEEIARALLIAEEGLTEGEADYELALRTTNAQIRDRNDLNQTHLEAGLDLADGLAALTDKEKGWKATLDDGTQAGRDNQREIINLTDDIEALGEATLDQTGSQDKANAAMRDARQDMLDQAAAAGYDRGEVAKLIDEILDIPSEAESNVYVNMNGAFAAVEALNNTLNTIDGRTATAYVTTKRYGQAALADGGVVQFNADGNLNSPEDHVAQIVPAGTWRVWGEDETGGEAYIPLAPSKRARSWDILADVANRFGATLEARANGSVDNGTPVAPAAPQARAPIDLSQRSIDQLARALLAGAEAGTARTLADVARSRANTRDTAGRRR